MSSTQPRAPGIRVQCACGAFLNVPTQYAGRQVRCKPCRALLTVPGAPAARAHGPLDAARALAIGVLSGSRAGAAVRVTDTPFSIGRARTCGLVLSDDDVSDLHCSIVDHDGSLHVVDHGSSFGTFVGLTRVEHRMPLSAGVELRLGGSCRLRLEPASVSGAAADCALPPDSGRPWGRSLPRKICCPSCWFRFPPEEVFFVAKHPELLGDPVLGADEYLRFQPTRFAPSGEALDPRGATTRLLACPRCHLGLPDSSFEFMPLFVSLIGSPASGKSHLLAAMCWELRRLMPRARVSFSDVDTSSNRVVHEYEQTIFMNERPDEPTEIRKTQSDDPRLYRTVLVEDGLVRYPVPLQFTLWPTAGHPERRRASQVGRVLVLYDNAGEDFLPAAEERTSSATEHLARVHILLFLFDPTQDPRFRANCRSPEGNSGPSARQPAGAIVRQETILREAIGRIRRLKGLRESERLRRPLVVIVSKLDAWEHLLPEPVGAEPYVEREGERITMATRRVEEVSAAVRNLLLRLCPEFVTTAEGLTDAVTYVPVSSLGRAPERVEGEGYTFFGIRPRDVSPRWVTVPMTYCFARWAPGLFEADRALEADPEADPTAPASVEATGVIDLAASDVLEIPELDAFPGASASARDERPGAGE